MYSMVPRRSEMSSRKGSDNDLHVNLHTKWYFGALALATFLLFVRGMISVCIYLATLLAKL